MRAICVYLLPKISRDFRDNQDFPGDARLLWISFSPEPSSLEFSKTRPTLGAFSDLDALLTRYARDKFERSQHAYRTQRAQIHVLAFRVHACRERRDEPAPKTHTPRHTLLLTTLLY